jgi:hypothetical protein
VKTAEMTEKLSMVRMLKASCGKDGKGVGMTTGKADKEGMNGSNVSIIECSHLLKSLGSAWKNSIRTLLL